MKKIEYKAPAMEGIKMPVQRAVLAAISGEGSGSTVPGGGLDD